MANQFHRILFAYLLCGGLIAACGGTAATQKQPEKGVLVVRSGLADAEIWLDNRYFREVAEVTGGIRLGPGVHRIEVRHSDHHSMYYEIELRPGERRLLDVELARRLP